MKNIFWSLITVSFLACSPKYYVPNTVNAPLISERGETNITAAGKQGQYEFQVGHGVGEHFGILANGSFFEPKDEDNGNGGSGQFFELGLGYFKPLGSNFVFDLYGLVGAGKLENHFPGLGAGIPNTLGTLEANILRYGVQPGIGFKTPYFSASLNPRIVMLNYSKVKGNLITSNGDQVAYLNDNNSMLLVEPALTIRGGFEKVKLQLQLGYSLNVTNEDFPQENSFVTVGLNFNFK